MQNTFLRQNYANKLAICKKRKVLSREKYKFVQLNNKCLYFIK